MRKWPGAQPKQVRSPDWCCVELCSGGVGSFSGHFMQLVALQSVWGAACSCSGALRAAGSL